MVTKELKRTVTTIAATPKFKLLKNHGLTISGRAHQFYAAGTVFDAETDAQIISALANSGAQMEPAK
jgi:hypothetical protein